MSLKIRFIKDFNECKKGDIFETSRKSAKSAVEQGYAEYVREPKTKLTKTEKEDIKIKSKIMREQKKRNVEKDLEKDDVGIIRQWNKKEEKYIPKYEKPLIELASKFSPKPYAEEMLKHHFFKYDNFRRFWIYDKDGGLWLEDAEEFIKSHLRKYLFGETNQKEHYAKEVVNYIKSISWTREIPEDFNKNIIAFKNCLANIDNGKIIEFDETSFITSKVNIEVDLQYKDCPKIDNFFEELVGKKNKSILYDLIAYCFYRGYPYQKMFILHGSGENGKTTYLDLLTYILGEQNISSETPQELNSKDFSKGNLWKKFANISSELPYTALSDTNTIKGLCGGDLIKCNRKYETPFQFRNNAKLIFAGNELPATNDKTYAFARRLYIIRFDKKIKNPKRNFINTLLTKEELSGLAWKCFQKLRLIKERNWEFEIDVDAEEMLKLYEELSNPLSKFLEEEIIEDGSSFIFKYIFKDQFESWCKNKGFRIWSDNELGRAMKERFSDSKRSIWLENIQKRYNAWEGIRLKKGKNN